METQSMMMIVHENGWKVQNFMSRTWESEENRKIQIEERESERDSIFIFMVKVRHSSRHCIIIMESKDSTHELHHHVDENLTNEFRGLNIYRFRGKSFLSHPKFLNIELIYCISIAFASLFKK